MLRHKAAILAPLACLALAACGDSAVSRGTSGAAIGAGTGAAVCAVTVIGILPCAIVGGALGGAGGVATAGPAEPMPATFGAAAAEAAPSSLVSSAGTPALTNQPPGAPVAAPQVPVTAEPLQ